MLGVLADPSSLAHTDWVFIPAIASVAKPLFPDCCQRGLQVERELRGQARGAGTLGEDPEES